MSAVLQVALDFVNADRALAVAREAAAGGAQWIEAGTPLIKSEGLDIIRKLRAEFPDHEVVADMKTMDAGRGEVEIAAKAGASVVHILGLASDSTLKESIEAGHKYGAKIGVDMINVVDPVARAREVAAWGAHHVIVHIGIDQQMEGATPFDLLKKISENVDVKLACAGGINSESVVDAVSAGADILIVGGSITKSSDAKAATAGILEAATTGVARATALYKRTTADRVKEILLQVSTANISDGNHRIPCMEGIRPIGPGLKVAGQAVTVRTVPGDWSKPVQAIDAAKPGELIVIDAGGQAPAVWGELATHSCKQRQVAGVVIDGAIRDTSDIRAMKFPAFSRIITSHAGDPDGIGKINIPIKVGGVRVEPGDWIVGDDDGVIVLPQARVAEMANYAMDCLERENRLREEIDRDGATLGQTLNLSKWDR
jgi:3-hexulose-6-phosphate synthase / 6-phospho-3-hexuloisomerase